MMVRPSHFDVASESFRTRVEAERYRGVLLQAGDRFDASTGEPVSWRPPLRDARVHEWVRRWLGVFYDCRHAAATACLRAGMPLGETARRLGHSVESLVSTYVGALEDEEHVGDQRVDTILR
jgi:integrase